MTPSPPRLNQFWGPHCLIFQLKKKKDQNTQGQSASYQHPIGDKTKTRPGLGIYVP